MPRAKAWLLWLCAGIGACTGQGEGPSTASSEARVDAAKPASTAGVAPPARAAEIPERRELTCLHPGDDARMPIVMFSGIGGTAEVFTPLAESLPDFQSFYAAPAHAGTAGNALSVRSIASAYEPAVRALRERGPIVLGGYSFGMLIAYELALRLREAGMPVAQLIALDAFAPGYPRRLEGWAWARSHLEELAASPERRNAYLEARFERLSRGLPVAGKASADDGSAVDEGAAEDPMGQLWSALEHASHTYVPARSESAPMLLFVAEEPFHWVATDTDDPLRGWRPHLDGDIETRPLQGTHLDVFEPPNDARLTRGVREVLYGDAATSP